MRPPVKIQGRGSRLWYLGFPIPAQGEEPSEEMVKWLNGTFNHDYWEGDDQGITVWYSNGVIEKTALGIPGRDYIVQNPLKPDEPLIIKKDEIDSGLFILG